MKEFTVEDEAKGILEYVTSTTGKSAEEIYKSFIDEAYDNLAPDEVFSPEEELEILFIEEHKEEIINEIKNNIG